MTNEELFYKGGVKTIMEAIYDYIYNSDEQTKSEDEDEDADFKVIVK